MLAGAALAAAALSLLDGLAVLPALAFGINEALSAALGAWVARLLRATGPDGRVSRARPTPACCWARC